ncbi:NIN-like protein [Artemisia annua]|uniref:NIN-like protein n=1 Tax=Artemisia annua TaxID=35608 RepID=A0A2U1QF25_ARTAN|nr:NIN-like protein [Artemisia annua]
MARDMPMDGLHSLACDGASNYQPATSVSHGILEGSSGQYTGSSVMYDAASSGGIVGGGLDSFHSNVVLTAALGSPAPALETPGHAAQQVCVMPVESIMPSHVNAVSQLPAQVITVDGLVSTFTAANIMPDPLRCHESRLTTEGSGAVPTQLPNNTIRDYAPMVLDFSAGEVLQNHVPAESSSNGHPTLSRARMPTRRRSRACGMRAAFNTQHAQAGAPLDYKRFGSCDKNNALVRLFRTARDKLQEADIPEFQIRLFGVIRANQYELSTADAIGAIVYDGGPENEPESPLPPSFSNMMVEQNILDPQMIKEKITSALKGLRFREKGVLVQFWSPVAVRKRWLLTTWDQPFGVCVADEELYSYRLKSELRAIVVDGEDNEVLGPVGRVYSKKSPEWSTECKIYGYIDLPVFEPSGNSCVGVLEIITSSNYVDYAFEVHEVSKALKKQNLKSPNVFEDHSIYISDERRLHELDGIFQALKTVCDNHDLPLAQTWALSEYGGFVANSGNLEQTCSSFDKSCIGRVCMSTGDLPFYVRDLSMWEFRKACRKTHLGKYQGVVGRSLSSCGSWFCRDVTEFGEADYPLVPVARMSGLASCLAIYLESLELDAEYVIEFFLPARHADEADLQRLLKTVKQQIKNTSCRQLDKLAPRVIGGLPCDWNLESSPSPIALLSEKEEDMENEPSNSVAAGKSQSVITSLKKAVGEFDTNPGKKRRKRKRSESSISLKEIQEHYGKPMDEAAAILHVSRSTLKRICRDLGIPRWPYRIPDKTDSLIKLDQTDNTHDLVSLAENGKDSPTVIANKVEYVMIKATYKNNNIKFPFSLLNGMEKLKELIAEKFQLKHGSLRLKYLDEDNDLISITSDGDLMQLDLNSTRLLYRSSLEYVDEDNDMISITSDVDLMVFNNTGKSTSLVVDDHYLNGKRIHRITEVALVKLYNIASQL